MSLRGAAGRVERVFFSLVHLHDLPGKSHAHRPGARCHDLLSKSSAGVETEATTA